MSPDASVPGAMARTTPAISLFSMPSTAIVQVRTAVPELPPAPQPPPGCGRRRARPGAGPEDLNRPGTDTGQPAHVPLRPVAARAAPGPPRARVAQLHRAAQRRMRKTWMLTAGLQAHCVFSRSRSRARAAAAGHRHSAPKGGTGRPPCRPARAEDPGLFLSNLRISRNSTWSIPTLVSTAPASSVYRIEPPPSPTSSTAARGFPRKRWKAASVPTQIGKRHRPRAAPRPRRRRRERRSLRGRQCARVR